MQKQTFLTTALHGFRLYPPTTRSLLSYPPLVYIAYET